MHKLRKIKNLYIIGNGFDLYHNLDTKYQSFAKYLLEYDNEIYEYVLNYYGLPDITSDSYKEDTDYAQWAKFESALSELDYEQVLEDKSDYAANLGDPDFKDRDWHSYQIEMEMMIEKLTTEFIQIFKTFIQDVTYPENIEGKRIELNDNSIFLNFNYTDTLERYYEIPENKICYIHNKATDESKTIILGHGIIPSNFKEKKIEPPKGLNDEEMEHWREHMSDQYDYSYESAKSEILTYYEKSFKDTSSIIKEKSEFFTRLSNVDKVFILGHSISNVDKKYFEEILWNIKNDATWVVSYYSEKEKVNQLKKLRDLGVNINRIKQIRIEKLKTKAYT